MQELDKMSSRRSTRSTKADGAMAMVLDEPDAQDSGDGWAEGLTDMQRAFVMAMTEGPTAGNSTKSAEIAGYSEKTAQCQGSRLLSHPAVAAAIDARLREAIGASLTAESVVLLRRVLRDEDAPLKLRAGVALKLVEFSGVVERTRQEKAKETGLDGTKKLTEFTRDDLASLVRNGSDLLKAAASLPPPGPVIEGSYAQDGAEPEPARSE